MKRKRFVWIKIIGIIVLFFIYAGEARAQALTSMPELSPVKMLILFLLDAYGFWKFMHRIDKQDPPLALEAGFRARQMTTQASIGEL